MQTRRKDQFCFELILLPRLCAFLNKGIFDSRLNSDNSYLLVVVAVVVVEMIRQSLLNTKGFC